MAMDLLERYLQAIGQFLPAEMKDDTVAELRANLQAEMDDRAEALGRELSDDDVAALLKAHGKPQVVALRYLRQRSLIGPTVFPFYELTLKRVLPLVVLVSFVAQGIVFGTSQRMTFAEALGNLGAGLFYSLVVTVAAITAVFAVIERVAQGGEVGGKWKEWDPRKLPAVKTQGASVSVGSMVQRVLELAIHCVWFAYVLWAPWHPFWVVGPGVFYLEKLGVQFAPVWHTFYALLLVVLSLQLVMKLAALLPAAVFPAVQGKLKPMRLATDALGLVAIAVLGWSSTLFVAAGAGADLHQIAAVNHMVALSMRIVLVIVLAGFVKEVWVYVKRTETVRRLAF
jgi:hypothetical protein